MAVTNFEGGVFTVPDAPGGLATFREPGTTINKDTYTTAVLDIPNSNPVVLDSKGRANVWLQGDYDVSVVDAEGVIAYTADNINTSTPNNNEPANLIVNPSFENTIAGGTLPSDWVVELAPGNGVITLDTSVRVSGVASLKFLSSGVGVGRVTSAEFFEVGKNTPYVITWSIASSPQTMANRVLLLWYDFNKVSISSTVLYDNSTNNPTSFGDPTTANATSPSGAAFCKLTILGGYTNVAGQTLFDDFYMGRYPRLDADNRFTGENNMLHIQAAGHRVFGLGSNQDVPTIVSGITYQNLGGAIQIIYFFQAGVGDMVVNLDAVSPAAQQVTSFDSVAGVSNSSLILIPPSFYYNFTWTGNAPTFWRFTS